MALRIPIGADQTLQVEFHEIERRLRRLEKATGTSASQTTVQFIGGGVSQKVDLKPITDRLEALEDAILDLSDPASIIGDFGAVGASSSRGLVPTPGVPVPPIGVGQHLVTESGTWGFPLRGLIGVVTPGDETVGSDTVNLLANLVATGKVVATGLEANEVRSHGIVYGEPEQARLRGLLQIVTEPGQTELVDDVLTVPLDIHTQDVSAVTISAQDVYSYGTIYGGNIGTQADVILAMRVFA